MPNAATATARHVATRSLVLVAALIAALLVSTVANLTATARASTPSEPLKAVIVVGPASGSTSDFLSRAEQLADAAEGHGMEVTRIYHPNALWSQVVDAAQGANLFVYLGHGNGWPSSYPPFQEDTKDGLGLNFPDPAKRGVHETKYYGGDWIREHVRFAPNAIVMFHKLCYAGGHGEDSHPRPTYDVAFQRVDNYAAAFLTAGARTVFHLTYQNPVPVLDQLMNAHTDMESILRMRFSTSTVHPALGWVGDDPRTFDSVRTPGARVLMDPSDAHSYRRALSGDLTMTTDEWKGAGVEDPDGAAPVVDTVSSALASDTLPGGDRSPAIFTPNGDKLSDTLTLTHTVSEPAYLRWVVRNGTGDTVREFTTWTDGGEGSTTWDGRAADGTYVAEGRYEVTVTPRDRSGKVGADVMMPARVFRTMFQPKAAPALFFARDADALAQTSTFSVTLTRDADLSWKVVDGAGDLVRTLLTAQPTVAGVASVVWDGKDDLGAFVPDGSYYHVVTSRTDAGTYSHRLVVRHQPFHVTAPRWSGPAGTKVTFTMNTAEAVDGYPRIEVRQSDLTMYKGWPVRYTTKQFRFTLTFRSGGLPGPVAIKMITTDTSGGKQNMTVYFELTP
jgi:flagellar hook assembly protein FlgD